MWSEKLRIDDLKKMDICVREAMTKNGAKHYQQMNGVLYLSKIKGGRGLKSLEQTYKETKIKAAIKLLGTTDERIKLVTKFQENIRGAQLLTAPNIGGHVLLCPPVSTALSYYYEFVLFLDDL